jgi:hypothetical protein
MKGMEGMPHALSASALREGQLHAPDRYTPPGKSPRYPLDRRLGGPQSRSGGGGEGKETPVPSENRNPVVQPVV